MRKIIFSVVIILSHPSLAQINSNSFAESLELNAGVSKHGTGDLSGFSVTIEYQKLFKKKILWWTDISSTLHDGAFPISYTGPNGNLIDASVRYTTGGIQVAGGLGLKLLKTTRHDAGIQAGGMVRYQSSSDYDELLVLYPVATNLPYPATFFIHRTPQRTLAFGGLGRLFYNFALTNRLLVGLNVGLQGDTNGDVITQLSLRMGRRF